MSKLWSKGVEPDALIEAFTVGEDYLWDQTLVPADVLGSLAHGLMLSEIQILTPGEYGQLKTGLGEILDQHGQGQFVIRREDEDGHTAIENYLVQRLGDTGKKIHTGRSRNDQILVTLRLWMRAYLFRLMETGGTLVQGLLDLARKHEKTPMPGRTHMQPAMPSSVGLWAAAWGEQLLDDLRQAFGLQEILDQNPLGAAAGYGTPLPLDRERTAALLGFSRVQNNVIYVNNSRGRFEARLLEALEHIGLTLAALSQDLILFSLPEFGWFQLPEELCTGSSIMPQKRNPDALELMRAKAATLTAQGRRVKDIIRGLPSGYNRDFQETKAPLLEGASLALAMLEVMTLTVTRLEVNEDRLRAAFTPPIFATDAVFDLVAQGRPFREAYREVGAHPELLSQRSPDEVLASRRSTGTPGNPCFQLLEAGLAALLAGSQGEEARLSALWKELADREVRPAG